MRPIAFALLTLTLMASSGPASAATVRVAITDQMQFSPNKVTVQLGDTVEFVNESRINHTVTADPALAADPLNVILPTGAAPFHSGRLTPTKTFTQKFTVPGLYQYVCLPHEKHGMRGQIEVLPAPVKPCACEENETPDADPAPGEDLP